MNEQSNYEQRRERRIERQKQRAEKLRSESQAKFDQAHDTLKGIPPGQPILVDHYSAPRHRNALKRHDQRMRKAFELDKAAKSAELRAKGSESRYAIDSDDPDAPEKLREKIESLEAEREAIKNRAHESWELSNIGATIRRTKRRLEQVEKLKAAVSEPIDREYGRVSMHADYAQGRVLFTTPERNDEAYKLLRSRGWTWSRARGCFTRKITANAIAAAMQEVGPKLAEIFPIDSQAKGAGDESW